MRFLDTFLLDLLNATLVLGAANFFIHVRGYLADDGKCALQ